MTPEEQTCGNCLHYGGCAIGNNGADWCTRWVINPDVVEAAQPLTACPRCGHEKEDFDGLGVLYCTQCGYCKHASRTDGKCDYCGKEG